MLEVLKMPFCLGILVTLSLSIKKRQPIGLKIFSLHNIGVGCPYELKFKRVGKKSLKGFQNARWRFGGFVECTTVGLWF